MEHIKRTSINFQFAKVVAILMVVFGHFYTGLEIFWVPVTVGLFVFAYSSAYFTTAKYKDGFDRLEFWKKKISRIGMTLLFVDIFLLVLFLIQERENIWNWESIVSALGLTGLLNWFSIHNQTPFGKGLWFLTLLYLFYAFYPMIKQASMKKNKAIVFAIVFSLFMWVLNLTKPMGHSLWLTACGFVWGVVIKNNKISSKIQWPLSLMVFSFVTIIITNFILSVKVLNFPLILIFALTSCLVLEKVKIPMFFVKSLSFLNGTIFFIYLLHGYLFLKLFQSNLFNTIVSIAVVCLVSKLLEISQKQIVLIFKSFSWPGIRGRLRDIP